MALGATGYNLVHLQVGPKAETPTYVDINYATTFETSIDQDNEYLRADGGVKITAYGAREGSGSLGFGSADLQTIATMSGDTFSTSGTAGTVIDRLEVKGATSPPSVILVAWVPNVDGNEASAGMRVTLPNAKVAMPSTTFEQEAWTEFEADMSFVSDENDVMLIIETLATAPVFTSGVIPTNLEPPA